MAVTTHALNFSVSPSQTVPYQEDKFEISDVWIYHVNKQSIISCDTEYISCKTLLLLNIVFVSYSYVQFFVVQFFVVYFHNLLLFDVAENSCFNRFVSDSMFDSSLFMKIKQLKTGTDISGLFLNN